MVKSAVALLFLFDTGLAERIVAHRHCVSAVDERWATNTTEATPGPTPEEANFGKMLDAAKGTKRLLAQRAAGL